MNNIEFAKDLINKFNKENKKLYLVGGSVRDFLLFNDISDLDFATPESLETIQNILKTVKFDDFSAKFGTFHTIYNTKDIQITRFRKEEYSLNSRHPKVTFSNNINDDFIRRDFTINALYYDGKYIYDFTKGLKDLRKGIIRSINNPLISFKEDPLRMLRMIRFSIALSFKISKRDLKALEKCKENLIYLSKEKINEEINKLNKYLNKKEIIDIYTIYNIIDYIKDKML